MDEEIYKMFLSLSAENQAYVLNFMDALLGEEKKKEI